VAGAGGPRGGAHVEAPSDRLTPTRGRREAAPILSLLTSGFLDGRARASAWARRWRRRGRSVSGTDRAAAGGLPVAARHVGAASGGAAGKVRMARRGREGEEDVMGRIRMSRRRRRDDEAAMSYVRGRCVVGS
jgi:hypothetical protein